jgi:hypothetical protein
MIRDSRLIASILTRYKFVLSMFLALATFVDSCVFLERLQGKATPVVRITAYELRTVAQRQEILSVKIVFGIHRCI